MAFKRYLQISQIAHVKEQGPLSEYFFIVSLESVIPIASSRLLLLVLFVILLLSLLFALFLIFLLIIVWLSGSLFGREHTLSFGCMAIGNIHENNGLVCRIQY